MKDNLILKTVVVMTTVFLFLTSCQKRQSIRLKFLDEYVIQDSLLFKSQFVGGLSGINYSNGFLYFVIDDAKNPRVLKASLSLNSDGIEQIQFQEVININISENSFFDRNVLDLEDLFVDFEQSQIYLTSEGSINYGITPSVFRTDLNGEFIDNFVLPKAMNVVENYKHNATFEALSNSADGQGFWITTEAPLHSDGAEPEFVTGDFPVRMSYFDKESKKITRQYVYHLDHIRKPSKGSTNLNGVTAILEYKKDCFIVLERAYQSGYGSFGNTVNLFEVKIVSSATNVFGSASLRDKDYIPLEKTLLFSFDSIKDQLEHQFVDNLEGMTFGPKLNNGNSTLLLIADDNFQLYGPQLNQVILMEILSDKE